MAKYSQWHIYHEGGLKFSSREVNVQFRLLNRPFDYHRESEIKDYNYEVDDIF